ncbi:hypothetical protein VNO78_00348 [Psophocarpus tetragonolobus]|uniref:Uncharacterized protein n=1 Tax=Psophocarpus tetragonolobus TaxID=3891 RepID=A0AAN9XTR0_PSOTE
MSMVENDNTFALLLRNKEKMGNKLDETVHFVEDNTKNFDIDVEVQHDSTGRKMAYFTKGIAQLKRRVCPKFSCIVYVHYMGENMFHVGLQPLTSVPQVASTTTETIVA